jgi:hypothetical protein
MPVINTSARFPGTVCRGRNIVRHEREQLYDGKVENICVISKSLRAKTATPQFRNALRLYYFMRKL